MSRQSQSQRQFVAGQVARGNWRTAAGHKSQAMDCVGKRRPHETYSNGCERIHDCGDSKNG